MTNLKKSLKQQPGKRQYWLIAAVIVLGSILAFFILRPASTTGQKKQGEPVTQAHAESEQQHNDAHAGGPDEDQDENHDENYKTEISLSPAQLAAQHITLDVVKTGSITATTRLPARLLVNADQQAHVSAGFAGRVEQVFVQTGQQVKAGQALASLLVPELIDLQTNLHVLQAQLQLAKSTYTQEKQLWQQGISAKQDYLQAQNAYTQANIAVQAAQSRLKAYGASASSQGRFILKSPLSGVISSKDLVVGESIQASEQLFVIDQLNQLWLEFVLPDQLINVINPDERLIVEVNRGGALQTYRARLISLAPSADVQTGRMLARAVLDNPQQQLRPNMQVVVQVPQAGNNTTGLMVQTAAIQQIDQQDVVFVASRKMSTGDHSQDQAHTDQLHFVPRPVQLGQKSNDQQSNDQQWVEIRAGLQAGEQYAAQGSFILKSELEKGEAAHEH
ncbi:efflux RND transporter periplasmic adaptor subunit [Alkanindiges illinoisensis]|uniref:Efflux RND transporter periplasmic adaptor subunit n=1 Tax=Alkanindiges illinoisensis TaxID=197183 RepID=A0A4Y7XBL9_9GAMM|nr:efflux RND transporter periplasmic adaptor subunit [Alkanindiges illinoisensis]TEU26433.1 efflux RND transporter periplasmic adaptor subunit [Alkanindiges illinoisensis]